MNMPPRHERWSEAAKRTWEAWAKTKVAKRWDAAQVDAAGRLLRIVEELSSDDLDADARVKLQKELRRGETDLGLRKRPSAKGAPEPRGDHEQRNAEHRAEREELKEAELAACAEAGVSMSDYELSSLDDPEPERVSKVKAILRREGWNPDTRARL